MLNQKKFFNRKTITLMVASVVIIALLITVVACGWAKQTCGDCNGVGEVTGQYCETCNGVGTIAGEDCEVCGGTGIDTVCHTCGGTGKVFCSAWALLPPIIAIGLALITKEVFSSLFIGIVSGGILAADFAPLKAMDTVVNVGLIDAVSGTAGIFIFLIELGVIVALVNKAGGSRAFGEWAQTHVKTRGGAMLCTFALGVLIFIDDYFNCLTVGSVMRPVTDKHKISRSKLAYLIDATAAPVCMIAPISSWAAAVSKYVADGQGFTQMANRKPNVIL